MISLIVKVVLTAVFIVAMSELAKRSSFLSALLIALPLATALTAAWLYIDTGDAPRAADYALSVLWLLPPGCLFLVLLPLGVRLEFGFWPSFMGAALITGLIYYPYAYVLQRYAGVTL